MRTVLIDLRMQQRDGNDIVYCRDGARARQSCTELGFAGCDNGRCIL
jgi:hypothetical protein